MPERPQTTPALGRRNFKLVLEYDGSAYSGWQRQPDQPTVQGALEAVLRRMTGRPVTLHGSGRTDAGVHAWGQTAHFTCATRLSAEALRKGLNSLLPADIAVRSCRPAPPDFHARFDALWKRYRYRICNQPIRRALGRQYAWQIYRPLDLAAMQAGADLLVGRHDFTSFEASGSPRAHAVREVMEAFWREHDGHLEFEIRADGFLRGMVRNIVGALVAVGRGKLAAGDLPLLLAAADRRRAPATAPPHGLFLVEVAYPPAAREPDRAHDAVRPVAPEPIDPEGLPPDDGRR
jgi:tRNA pseudouridine38-40 synthase